MAEAKQFVVTLLGDAPEDNFTRLAPALQAQGGPDTLRALSGDLRAAFGELEGIGSPQQIGPAVNLPVIMQRQSILVQIVFDEAGRVINFDYLALDAAEKDETMIAGEEAVQVGPKGLAGLLTMPQAGSGDVPFPAVVLVHGSGSSDWNMTFEDTAIFRDLAHDLAAQGIAVLRYDKRTYAWQTGALPYSPEEAENLNIVTETIEDAVAAAALLRADSRIDPGRVFILGHSQGAVAATWMQQEGAAANGLILLAGSLRHLHALAADQLRNMDYAGLEAEIALAETIGGKTEAEARALTLLGGPAYPYWFEAQHDHLAAAEENTAPMLILQGEADTQVFYAVDFALWQDFARQHPDKDITLTAYPALGHYFTEGKHISADVLRDIAAWIQER